MVQREGLYELITEGDTEDWVYVLEHPETQAARDITGATAKLYMWKLPGYEMVIDGESVTVDGSNGKLTYDVQAADVDDDGEYERQWVVTLSGGEQKTYPDPMVQERDYLKIKPRVESTDT